MQISKLAKVGIIILIGLIFIGFLLKYNSISNAQQTILYQQLAATSLATGQIDDFKIHKRSLVKERPDFFKRPPAVYYPLPQIISDYPDEANQSYSKATDLIKQKQFALAQDLLLDILKIDPSYWEASYQLAAIYIHHLDNCIKASDLLKVTLELNPYHAESYLLFAECEGRSGNKTKQREALEKAIILNPEIAISELQRNLEFVSRLVGDYFLAIQNQLSTKKIESTTNLSTYALTIPNADLLELFSDLPESGGSYVKAVLNTENQSAAQVEVKLRGVGYWHYQNPKKSWRIKTKISDSEDHVINLINSRHKQQIIYDLGYSLGSEIGLISPKSDFAKLYINGVYYGVFALVEQIDQNMIVKSGYKRGDLFFGEPDGYNPEIVDDTYGVFADPEFWDYKQLDDTNLPKLKRLLDLVVAENLPQSWINLDEIIDRNSLLRYIALLNLLNSEHITTYNNFRLYLNPDTNKFIPIVWDAIAWLELDPSRQVTDADNILFNKYLQIPEVLEQKNKYLWDFINQEATTQKVNSLINKRFDQLKATVANDPYIDFVDSTLSPNPANPDYHPVRPLSQQEWVNSISLLKEWYRQRHKFIATTLDTPEVKAYFVEDLNQLVFIVEGEVGITPLTNLKLQRETGEQVNLNQEAILPGIKVHSVYPSGRSEKVFRQQSLTNHPLVYRYNLGRNLILPDTLKVKNRITGTVQELTINKVDAKNIPLPKVDSDSIHPWSFSLN